MAESIFVAAVELYNGNHSDVIAWVKAQTAEAQARIATAKSWVENDTFNATAQRLDGLVGRDEALPFLGSLPGLNISVSERARRRRLTACVGVDVKGWHGARPLGTVGSVWCVVGGPIG